MKARGLLLVQPDFIDMVFGDGRVGKFEALLDLADGSAAIADPSLLPQLLADTEVIVSTWGMPCLTPELLEAAPKLRAVFYAAGSVKYFVSDAMWERDIVIVSAWAANAIPVAEYTVAQIVLGLKNYWAGVRASREAKQFTRVPMNGCYGKRVGLIGVGMIGKAVRQLLRQYNLEVLVADPYLSHEAAEALGTRKTDLDEIFATCHCVSLHAPNIPETAGMVREEHFMSMLPDACFVNTSRGALVDEPGLVRALRARPDLTALLDVTNPEPPPADSEMWSVPNLIMSPHVAGSVADECRRMADYCIAELTKYLAREPLEYRVTRDMMDRMA